MSALFLERFLAGDLYNITLFKDLIQRILEGKSVGVHSSLPVLLRKEGVKIVSGYTEVNARITLAGKSVGVYSFLPV